MSGSHRTLGRQLASRLVEIGINHVFGVPGDYNLVLLDQLLLEEKLAWVGTCNELNAGYAADGYARVRGAAACVVTFTVGGLSIINAIAGSYSEDLPVIIITGGPNSNDYGTNRILHHTIGLQDRDQELRCFKEVTCDQVVINHIEDAHALLDRAISSALRQRKPVYINIACNLAGEMHATFDTNPIPFAIYPKVSNPRSLEAAVEAAAQFLNSKGKAVLVAGFKLRPLHAKDAFLQLADASGYPVAAMANAKGFFPEDHPSFMGTYWGSVSSPFTAEIVESADAAVVAGPILNDYTTTGWTLLLVPEKIIVVHENTVIVGGAQEFHCVCMAEFLAALAGKITKNTKSMEIVKRMYVEPGVVAKSPPGSPLLTKVLYKHLQNMLTPDSAVIAETGDSWFNCQKLKLPNGCGYEFQCQFGSIGWSVGATLGYSMGAAKNKRVIASIGDGSFQVTAQDVSTMIRMRMNPIIFLVNNAGYTIEVEIHDGPYNKIAGWDYVKFVEAIGNGSDAYWAIKVETEEELEAAIVTASGEMADRLCFIECIVDMDDCSKELLEWGSRVAAANARPPRTIS